jgi:cyanophycinase
MGVVALIGGKPFTDIGANREVATRLLAASGGTSVLVLPTADAFEQPQVAVDDAVAWFAGLGASVTGLMVLARRDAQAEEHARAVAAARFVLLVGDSPMHQRSALKDTSVWAAIEEVSRTGVVAAAGAAAAGLCDPMTDTRGGAFGLGLGLVRPLAIVHEAESWSHDRLHRTRQLAQGFPLAVLPSGTALVNTDGRWDRYGDGIEVHGELP